MSKAITCEVQLTSAATRSDGSLSLRFCTPELDAPSKTAFMELLNLNLKMLLQPMTGEPSELHDVKRELETKTPSMRLRAVLFIAWRQASEPGEFEDWYRRKMDSIIERVKQQLEPV